MDQLAEHARIRPLHGVRLASYVLPRSDDAHSDRVAITGTLLGALCFRIGAMLMFPARVSAAVVLTLKKRVPGNSVAAAPTEPTTKQAEPIMNNHATTALRPWAALTYPLLLRMPLLREDDLGQGTVGVSPIDTSRGASINGQ